MGEDLRDLGEFGLIDRVRRLFAAGPGVVVGIGDDAAAVELGPGVLLTTDMAVQGVHFDLALSSPQDAGHKALCSNVSDIAAMGGRPRYAVVALGAPPETPAEIAEGVAAGIAEAAASFGVSCVGGDTVTAPVLVVAITVAGEEGPAGPVRRSTARPGDLLVVTGSVGAAAAGLAALRAGADDLLRAHPHLAAAHRRGQARVREGLALAASGVTAMIDVSDGVGADAAHLARESGIGVRVLAENLPLAPGVAEAAALAGVAPSELALGGGEDYELLAALHPHDVDLVRDAIAPTPLTVIGEFSRGDTVEAVLPDGSRAPLRAGWEHFR